MSAAASPKLVNVSSEINPLSFEGAKGFQIIGHPYTHARRKRRLRDLTVVAI